MPYRIISAFTFPKAWSEIERARFCDAGVSRCDWFDGDLYAATEHEFADRDAAEAVMLDLVGSYKGLDPDKVGVVLNVEEN